MNYDYETQVGITALVVIAAISLILAVVCYYAFVKKDSKLKSNFFIKLRDFLNFKSMIIEGMLKVLYISTALFITIVSFFMISESFLAFLLTLVLGNIFARMCFEGSIVVLMIWKNTTEINKKTPNKVEE